jgi:hypothetical protein
LLLAHQFAELVHLLAHRAALLLLALLPACLEIVHHPLQFLQHLLGLIAGAGARQILDLVEHVVEIALAQHVLGHRLLHFGICRIVLTSAAPAPAGTPAWLRAAHPSAGRFPHRLRRFPALRRAHSGHLASAVRRATDCHPQVAAQRPTCSRSLHADPRRTWHFQAGREPTARADNETGRGSFLPGQL